MAIEQSASVKDQIREFIQRDLASAKGVETFSDSESLMESGVIDSLGIFRLVAFLEETFRVRIGDEEITHDNLKSVDSIEQMVVGKLKK
jgi:acyl carrier protein